MRGFLTSYVQRLLTLQQESLGVGEGQDPFAEQPFTIQRRDEMSLDAFTLVMKRFRRIGKLWTSASGIGTQADRDEGKPYSPAQIIFPPWRDAGNDEQITFVRWNFDERLNTQGMGSILDHISDACLENGHAIIELVWLKETGGKYPGKVVIQDILCHDPQFFVLDPKGLPPGIYLKQYTTSYTVTREDLLPSDRFKVVTLHKRYHNLYGISEFQLIDKALRYFWQIYAYHARGVERSGVGAYVATTGKNLVDTKRDAFITAVKEIRSNTVTFVPEGSSVEQLPSKIAADAFDKFEKLCLSIVSLVGTGSATTFFESQFGTYGEKQAVDVAEKSDLEISSASLLSEFFSYQIIPLLLDKNYADVQSYCAMQLVELQLIQPTITQAKTDLIETQQDSMVDESEDTEEESATEEDTNAEPTQTEFVRHFAEGEEPPKKNLTVFPIQAPAPDIYDDVSDAAETYLREMPSLPVKDHRNLSDEEKHDTFTISAVGSVPFTADMIEALKNAIADTITITNESQAWPIYIAAAKKIYRGSGVVLTEKDLLPSWKFARQKAYSEGINMFIESNKGNLFGIRYHTQDDNRVRHTHLMFEGLTRPVGDPIWEKLKLPLGFGCRCWLEPVSFVMQEAEPDKYKMTTDEDVPTNIPKPFKEGYEPEEEEITDEP